MTVAARLAAFGTATIFEAAGKRGAMSGVIRAVWPGARVVGRARTVTTPAADNLSLHWVLPDLQPGDVLVVDAQGDVQTAVWGDVMTAAAQAVGVAGLVVDGAVRDVAAIAASAFPVFARGVAIPGPAKAQQGQIDGAIICGGTKVRSGDWILGDADGVVVVAADQIEPVLAAAKGREDAERAMIARLRAGQTTTLVELGLAGRAKE